MALPQQGTETQMRLTASLQDDRVNGLTPTGDGNILLLMCRTVPLVLMALPQQGTETYLMQLHRIYII